MCGSSTRLYSYDPDASENVWNGLARPPFVSQSDYLQPNVWGQADPTRINSDSLGIEGLVEYAMGARDSEKYEWQPSKLNIFTIDFLKTTYVIIYLSINYSNLFYYKKYCILRVQS